MRAITIIERLSVKIIEVICSSSGVAIVPEYRWPLLCAGFWRAGR